MKTPEEIARDICDLVDANFPLTRTTMLKAISAVIQAERARICKENKATLLNDEELESVARKYVLSTYAAQPNMEYSILDEVNAFEAGYRAAQKSATFPSEEEIAKAAEHYNWKESENPYDQKPGFKAGIAWLKERWRVG